MSVMKLHLVQFSRSAGRRHRRATTAVVSARADDILPGPQRIRVGLSPRRVRRPCRLV